MAYFYLMSEKGIINITDVETLINIDPVIGYIDKLYGIPPSWSRPPGFVSLAKIILEQQVSLASAMAHFNKLHYHIKEFTPEKIIELSDEEFRQCHISRQKSNYLRILANELLNGNLDLNNLNNCSEEDARRQLTRIKGIGNWTADIYLMFCLGAKNIFPIGDIAVVNTMKELYPVTTTDEIKTVAERWAPHRSLAVHFMWHYYLKKRNREFPQFNSQP